MASPHTLPRAIPSLNALLFGFSLRNKALFFRQLATMVGSAMPLGRAIQTSGTVTFPKLANEMAGLVDNGYPLSTVMGRYPHYFSDYEVAAVKTGEYAGSLDDQMELLAQELEKAYNLKQSLVSKLVYPVLVGHAAIFLPPLAILVTRGMSAYLSLTLGVLIPIYLFSALFFFGYRLSAQASSFRNLIDTVLVFIPVIGSAVRLAAVTRFLRVLAHLHEAGVLPDKALKISYDTCGNRYIASCVAAAFRRLGDTAPTSKVLAAAGVFPKLVPSMLATGEETGQTAKLLGKSADLTEQEMQVKMHRIVTIVPVLMLLAVGVVVGGLVINTFGSLAQMINNI